MTVFDQYRLGDILDIRSSSRVLESEYRDFGVPFLRGGELIKLDKGMLLENNLFISEELYQSLKKKTNVPKNGDLLITANGSVGYPYLVNLNHNFYFKDAIIWIKQNKKISNKFIYYIYKSKIILEQIINNTFGSTIINYNLNQARKNLIPLPSLSQQTAIANYIDNHTGKIDKEISLLEKKVEKLDEYKQALIYETVTKGLDKNVNFKDSCIDWIGMIPEHWEVKRVKEISKWQTGFTPASKNEEYYNGNDDWITIGDLDGKYVKDSKTKINGSLFPKEWITPANSLLFSFKLSIGQVSFNEKEVFTNEAICSFSSKSKINLKYFYYAAPIFIVKNAKKNIYNADLLNQDLIANAVIVLPKNNEQLVIANFLDEQCSKIDKKKELINKKIELLKEYKQSLIYEAVTGKIKIGE